MTDLTSSRFNHPVALTATQAENQELRAEIERLLGVCKDKTTLLKDTYAQIERLRHDWAIACKDLGEALAEIADLKSANGLLHSLIENRDADIERLKADNERLVDLWMKDSLGKAVDRFARALEPKP